MPHTSVLYSFDFGRRRCLSALFAALIWAAAVSPGWGQAAKAPAKVSRAPMATAATQSPPLSLAFVPRDAVAVCGIRMGRLLDPKIAGPDLSKAISAGMLENRFQAAPQEIESVVSISLRRTANDSEPTTLSWEAPAYVLRLPSGASASAIGKRLIPASQSENYEGQTLEVREEGGLAYLIPAPQTIVIAPSAAVARRLVIAGADSTGARLLNQAWQPLEDSDLIFALNADLAPDAWFEEQSDNATVAWGHFLEVSQAVAIGMRLSDNLDLQGVVQCASEQDARQALHEVFLQRSTCRRLLSGVREEASELPPESGAGRLKWADAADLLLDAAEFQVQGDRVLVSGKARPVAAAELISGVRPILEQRNQSASRDIDRAHLSSIMLGLYNYHEQFGHFPPAVIRDDGGRPLYSWRVALLPEVDESELYRQLRLDEPFDSEHNGPLLQNVPEVYRSPMAAAGSNSSSYFLVVGPHTAFAESEGGAISSIRDGTSWTIAVVEARRGGHWASAGDIPFDPDQPVTGLGGNYAGGFMAALCDGSVRFFPDSLDQQTIKDLIMRDDGHVIELP